MIVHYVEIVCEDGSRARLRADAIETVLERKTPNGGVLVTIPTRAKTLVTMHTMEDLWVAMTAALGGIQTLVNKAEYAPFPPKEAAKPVIKGVKAA